MKTFQLAQASFLLLAFSVSTVALPCTGSAQDIVAASKPRSKAETTASNIANLDFIKIYPMGNGRGECVLFANTKDGSLFGCGAKKTLFSVGNLAFTKRTSALLDKRRGTKTILMTPDLKALALQDPSFLSTLEQQLVAGSLDISAGNGSTNYYQALHRTSAKTEGVGSKGSLHAMGIRSLFEKLYEEYLKKSKNLPKNMPKQPPSQKTIDDLINKTKKEAEKMAAEVGSTPLKSVPPVKDGKNLGSGWQLEDATGKVTDIRVDGPHFGPGQHGPGSWLPHGHITAPDGGSYYIYQSQKYATAVMLTEEMYKKLRETITDRMVQIQKEMANIKDPKSPQYMQFQAELDKLYADMIRYIDDLARPKK